MTLMDEEEAMIYLYGYGLRRFFSKLWDSNVTGGRACSLGDCVFLVHQDIKHGDI